MLIHNRKTKHFTLVELLVSMAVFTILLTLMLQFFSGARTIWVGMEKKNNLYADARTVMDLCSSMLQTAVASQNTLPFVVENATRSLPDQNAGDASDDDKIYFITKTPYPIGGTAPIRLVALERIGTDGAQLHLRTFNDSMANFENLFKPFGVDGGEADFTTRSSNLKNLPPLTDPEILLKNVTGFSLTSLNASHSATATNRPTALELKLTLMDPEDYQRWSDMPAATSAEKTRRLEFRTMHEYTFARVIFFDDMTEKIFNPAELN